MLSPSQNSGGVICGDYQYATTHEVYASVKSSNVPLSLEIELSWYCDGPKSLLFSINVTCEIKFSLFCNFCIFLCKSVLVAIDNMTDAYQTSPRKTFTRK